MTTLLHQTENWDSGRFDPGSSAPDAGELISPPDHRDRAARQSALFARAIELDILPRLATRGYVRIAGLDRPAAAGQGAFSPEGLQRFVALLIAADATPAISFGLDLLQTGATSQHLLEQLITPAARELGVCWEDDRCSFAEVTIGVMRLQMLLRRLSPAFQTGAAATDPARRALLFAAPGEQHSFGVVMLSEYFRRAGWEVWTGSQSAGRDPVDLLAEQSFAVVGVSAASERTLGGIPALIRRIRRRSRNGAIVVMVGGPAFMSEPRSAIQMGADMTAADGTRAVQLAHELTVRRAAAAF